MNDALWRFSGIDDLYEALAPLTPYGQAQVGRRELLFSRQALEREYDLTAAMLAVVERGGPTLDQLTHHLRRIPRLPSTASGCEALDAPDIFLVKKFLANYQAVTELVPEPVRRCFGLDFTSGELLARLRFGGGEESFHLAEGYDERLPELRERIRASDKELDRLRTEAIERVRTQLGLDFRLRDFLVVENVQAAVLDRAVLYLEPHDHGHVVVKPVMPAEYFAVLAGRDDLLRLERGIEREALADLSLLICRESDRLQACAGAIVRLDLALARARLAQRFGLTRPVLLDAEGSIRVEGGRFLPLEARCAEKGERYWPLDVELAKPAAVIHGSNLCGKTVALRTLCELQLAAQLGLFVPARRFATVVFDQLHCVGTDGEAGADGLGSFGQEVVALAEALRGARGRILLVLDEFARSTNSREAVALLAGLLSWLDAHRDVRAILATHYTGLPDAPSLAYYRMSGLRPGGAAETGRADAGLAERVKAIHDRVEYVLLPDAERKPHDDALLIAEALGLDREIIAMARRHLE